MAWLTTLRTHGFRIFTIGITGCLALAAIAHLYLFDASEDAADRSVRYDIGWTGINGRIEAAHLEKSISRYAALGLKSDADQAKLYHDILRSRMVTWATGSFGKFIREKPRHRVRFDKLKQLINSLEPNMKRLHSPEAQNELLNTLAKIVPLVDRIGASAHTESVEESAEIRSDLHHHQQLQRWLVMLLLASGTGVLIFTAQQNRSLRIAHNATARHADELLFLARHDPLTKLPNRPAFSAAFEAALETRKPDERLLIAAIDLDDFKPVNDVLGHAAGDAILIAISKLLASEVARADPRNIVCRIGGDEFLALLWIGNEPCAHLAFAERILASLQHPVETDFGDIMINVSVGLATSDVSDMNDMIVNADLALTEAKTRGKGIALAFDPCMLAGQKRRLRLEGDLSAAIANSEIVTFYQPQIDLATTQLIGLEALARWRHPEFNWVSPGEFIPIAESSGRIVPMGRIVLETACRDAASLPEAISVAVNLSVVQILKDDIVGTVSDLLDKTGLSPARLKLETTESVMMSDPEKVLDTLKQLKTIGVRISLDDFGTGFSALSYLTQFEWDELKIDRSFLGRAWSDPMNLTIIRTVNMLAEKMNARVTIEGIETLEQCELLYEIGCDTGQGYLFGPALPLEELREMFTNCSTPWSFKAGSGKLRHKGAKPNGYSSSSQNQPRTTPIANAQLLRAR